MTTIRDCATGVLNAACTLLAEDEVPEALRIVPGPRFAKDCSMIAVQLDAFRNARYAAPGDRPQRLPAQATMPVWNLRVHVVQICKWATNNSGTTIADDLYSANVAAWANVVDGVWNGVKAGARQGTLFEPGIFGTPVPPEAPDVVCAGVEVGDVTFEGPNADEWSAHFDVTFQRVNRRTQ